MKGHGRVGKKFMIMGLTVFVLLVLMVSIVVPRLQTNTDRSAVDEIVPGGVLPPIFIENSAMNETGPEFAEKGTSVARSNIYDRNLNELAVSVQLASLYARPLEMQGRDGSLPELAQYLGKDVVDLGETINSGMKIVQIAGEVDLRVAEDIMALGMPGLSRVDKIKRFYPQHQVGAHVIGYQGDGRGLDGIEYYYDSHLSQTSVPGKSRNHLILTLDLRIQKMLEETLADLSSQTTAHSAAAIFMDSSSGAILGMASYPTFDPNTFWNCSTGELRNRLLHDPVFLGVINELFRFGAKLDELLPVSGEEKGPTIEGIVRLMQFEKESRLDGFPLESRSGQWKELQPRGFYASGWPITPQGSNVDGNHFSGFVRRLGLTEDIGIDLPQGTSMPGGRKETYRLTESVPSTTGLQLLTAFSRLVNGGKKITPHLLDSFWNDPEGVKKNILPPQEQVVHPEVSRAVLAALKKAAGRHADKPVFIESLIREDALADSPDQENKDNRPGEAGAMDNDSEPESEKSPGELKRFQAVMLGLAPTVKTDFTLLVTLDGGVIDPDAPFSPMRLLGTEFLKTATGQALKKPVDPSGRSAGQLTETTLRKIKILSERAEIKDETNARGSKEKMPDVNGLSLRKALRVLQASGLDIEIRGKGNVIRQSPPPGTELNGQKCILHLESIA
ncbi:PASTA domain-containing protein [Thermodesulfobacteriota bacterium]